MDIGIELGDALLAEDVVCRLRVPASEQLALFLKDEVVHLRVEGNDHTLPGQAGLEQGTVSSIVTTATTCINSGAKITVPSQLFI